MFLLVFLLGWLLFYTGILFSEWIERRKLKKIVNINELLSSVRDEKHVPKTFFDYFTVNVQSYFKKLNSLVMSKDELLTLKVENLLQEKELKMMKELDRIKMVIRIGPSLGLMGTLIPMGTGLASLSQGDINKLSSSLIIAFTTTVVGLGLGALSFFYATIKERWIEEDIKNIEVFTEALLK
jgi:biopolymer transport protein ExbB/TolQ